MLIFRILNIYFSIPEKKMKHLIKNLLSQQPKKESNEFKYVFEIKFGSLDSVEFSSSF